jgi:hypothetical protein
MQKGITPARWRNRPKMGFYQHFRRVARAFVASRQHRPPERPIERQAVESLQVVSL